MAIEGVIKRDSVYVGQVAKVFDINDLSAFIPYRSILFTLDDDDLSIDLLYDSPKYPILSVTDKYYFDKLMKNSDGIVVIKDACNWDELLQRFNFSDELSLEDIIKIRKMMFNNKFLYDNCNEFGLMRQLPPSNVTHVDVVGMPKTHYPTLIKNKLSYFFDKMLKQEGFEMLCTKIYSENYYMTKYWKAIRNLGDDQLIDFFHKGFDIKLDAFKPLKEEGPVKRLVR